MKNVLLATRPLSPPWDEASKNFGYFLGRSVTGHKLTLLTAKGAALTGLPGTVTEEVIYESPVWSLREKIALLKYLRNKREGFDIVHYLFTPTKLNTTLIRQFAFPASSKTKTIQTVATLREDIYDNEELKSLLFADRIVVYSDASKKKLERLGFANVTRIYPGIDLNLYKPSAREDKLLESFGFGRDKYLVVYPGEYSRLGATDMIVEGLLKHFEKEPQSRLRFVFACRVKNTTDLKKKKKVREIFAQTGLLDKVVFTDTLYDMPALYSTADVIIFPVTNMHGKFDVPLVIIEAYACGKPVVLSDLPLFTEFSGKDFSVTVPKGDGDALFSLLSEMRDNPEHYASLGVAARVFAEKNFDLKKTAGAYAELYESM